jgi:hypothetical protein|tara:strand:- start:421 stop:669 length:249 start_codon:yes stop_codon:yes gene_type:complete
LESYKNFVGAEQRRLQDLQHELDSSIRDSRQELESISGHGATMTSGFSMGTENMEELRRQLGETSILLEEQRERYKRSVAKS